MITWCRIGTRSRCHHSLALRLMLVVMSTAWCYVALGTVLPAAAQRRQMQLSLQEATAAAVMQTAAPTEWVWHGRIPKRPGLSDLTHEIDGD